MKSTQQISCAVDSWIAEEELPPRAGLKVIRRNDLNYGLTEDEIQDRNEFIRCYLLSYHELLTMIPQQKPVRVYFLTYSGTMQTRLMQLMADKLMCSLAIEGELSDKGLAALSETSDSMAKELAKMLVEKSESGDNRTLKDIWADYRKKEVQVEMKISKDITGPVPEPETISKEETHKPTPEIKMASSEVEKIGDRIVKVQFIEYVGKRKKKVTHIEVKEAELDEMLKKSDKPVQAQFSLF